MPETGFSYIFFLVMLGCFFYAAKTISSWANSEKIAAKVKKEKGMGDKLLNGDKKSKRDKKKRDRHNGDEDDD